jgi:hypothetical protein
MAHFMVPPAMAVTPIPNELIFIKFLLVCILLIFRVFVEKQKLVWFEYSSQFGANVDD